MVINYSKHFTFFTINIFDIRQKFDLLSPIMIERAWAARWHALLL